MLSAVDELRVFISSTSADLQEHREAVRDAVMGMDHHPVDMIYWSADPRSGTELSLDRVRRSDVLILLVAHRYGHVPEGSIHSVTEQEYRAAREADVPVLAFFLDGAVPWPPDFVEYEARDRLSAFRELVESEVARKLFRTPAELATQVVQSLVLLERHPPRPTSRRFRGPVREVSLPTALQSRPDVLVPIGRSEDGLPLLLDVHRSRDLSGPFAQLAQAVGSPWRPAPQAMFEDFRQSLEEFAHEAWAADRVLPVQSAEGMDRQYVSSFTLTEPFTSVLAAIVEAPGGGRVSRAGRARRRGARATITGVSAFSEHRAELQSSGGRNRFLAVDPGDGRTYSVGRHRGGVIVQWRPFLCENALAAFPDCSFETRTGGRLVSGPVAEAGEILLGCLVDHPRDPLGRFGVQTTVNVGTQAAVDVVVAVARELEALHATGRTHGDVKPHNVLLTAEGTVLIDSFDVEIGLPAPGWTPDWSAPEQVLGMPMTAAADVYPLAGMLSELLGCELVGEVRAYVMPDHDPAQEPFTVFHNPSLYANPAEATTTSAAGLRAWRKVIERGLRFDPAERPGSMADFAAQVESLSTEHPLEGVRSFRPSGELMAARLADGADAVVRVITDPPVPPAGAPAYGYAGPGWRAPLPSPSPGPDRYMPTQTAWPTRTSVTHPIG